MASIERAETRKQQIARRLKVSERVLEQYLQSKQAEVEESEASAAASGGASMVFDTEAPRRQAEAPRRQREKRI
ncbi:MAG: hypothetical protein WD273_10535 [Trueperaceae bacterium]